MSTNLFPFRKLHKSNSTSMIQRRWNNPRPVRDYQRFPKERISGTGISAYQSYEEFSNKDLIHPLKHDSLYPDPNYHPQKAWALHTTKLCPSAEKLPKLQQYKQYIFPRRIKEEAEKYQNSFLESDHIGVRIPAFVNEIDEKRSKSFIDYKNQYGVHSESEKTWEPSEPKTTLTNKSSVTYDIINHEKKDFNFKLVSLQKDVNKNKKGVGEFADLTKTFATNFNKKYQSVLNSNEKIFYNHNGIFSHMYDLAHRNGNIIMPFRQSKIPAQRNKNRSFMC